MESSNKKVWELESLRLTSFLGSDFNSSPMERWLKELSGGEPLSINKGVNFFQGLAQINSSMLKLTWNANRIDLFLNSNAPQIETCIGLITDVKRLMKDIFFNFFDFKDCPASKRLAFGVILNIPIKDFDEGNSILSPKLKSVSDIAGTTDFLFRINRPVQSEIIKELKLNRLMTWSVGYLQVIKIPLIIGQNNFIQQEQNSQMICRLELDFNTVEYIQGVMTANQQKEISIELIEDALLVAEKGEFGLY